jgi:hypothetical protein
MEVLVRDLLAYTQVMKLDTGAGMVDSNEVLKTALANLNEASVESGRPLRLIHCHPCASIAHISSSYFKI